MGAVNPTTFSILTYRAFEPTEISGLKAWYDASTINQADGTNVSAWLDSSGNEAHMYQSTTSAQPTLQTNELNGRAVVRFDGTDDFMNLTAPFDVEPIGTPSLNSNSFSNNGTYYTQTGNSNVLFFYKKNGNVFNKLNDPATMPQGVSYEQTWSANDDYFAVASTTTPRVTIYQRSNDVFTKLSDPSTLPVGSAYGCHFSYNNDYLAVGHTSNPYFTIYKTNKTLNPWSFTKLTNPSPLPTGIVYSVKFSDDDSFLCCAMNASPYVQIYSRSGDVFTKLTNPSTLPTSTQNSISWLNSTTFAITGTQPVGLDNFIYIYQYNGTNFELLTSINIGPTSATTLQYSRNKNYLAVGFGTSPRFRVYSVSGTTYTAISNPATLPISTGRGVAWGLNDTSLVVAHTTSPNVQAYTFDGTTLTNLTNLNMFRNVSGGSIFIVRKCNNFTSTSLNVSITTNSSGSIRLYSAQLSTNKVRTSAKRLDADTTANLDAITSSTNNHEILSHVVDYANSDAYFYLNGILDVSSTTFLTNGNTSDTNSAIITLGSFTGSNFLNGDIAEVIIFNRTLTTQEIKNIHYYLATKYNISVPL